MAVPLKGKLTLKQRLSPRRLWFLARADWRTGPSIKQELLKDKDAYLVLLGGVALGYLVAVYIVLA